MSDRLRELLRQRALLQEHLAWLEKEIAAAAEKEPEAAANPAVSENSPAELRPAAAAPRGTQAGVAIAAKVIGATTTPRRDHVPGADALLEEYRVPSKALQSDVQRGCFLYLIAAFLLLALGVATLWFTIGTR